MKEIVKEMLAHPIASLVVIGAIGSAVASIVSAAAGNTRPVVGLSLIKEVASDGKQVQA